MIATEKEEGKKQEKKNYERKELQHKKEPKSQWNAEQ